ncbi:hypothetical protein PINS_up023655 [Pythium insidiosum]|nr:hypothetical protein PINS_up023655 [Pythium insidiosum]
MEQRVRAAGLQDRVEVLLSDFRELVADPSYRGSFDRVVSLEMIRGARRPQSPLYFATSAASSSRGRSRLHPGDHDPRRRYDQYCRNTDFIKEYIFPGGHLPSRARMYWAIQEGNATVERDTTVPPSTALAITHEYNFGRAYASTLACVETAHAFQPPPDPRAA